MTEMERSPEELDQSSDSVSHTKEVGGLLVAGGVIGAVLLKILGGRRVLGWLAVAGMIGGGLFLLVYERRASINTATERIEEDLDGLDPLAKAQVLKTVAEQEVGRIQARS